ncbi:MAG TPA: TRAP transporter small permease [Burkholderiales bacterium]|nr:TRAP transporter small permease [Burkholderiales bacterium]
MWARWYERVIAAQARAAAALLVLMVALIFLNGVARVLGHPVNWAVDAATCLFAWACFFCADIAWRKGSLMAITLLVERLPAAAQRAVRLANYAVISAFLAYAVVGGVWLAWVSRARSFQGIPEVSYSWVTASMPVGCALLLVTTLLKVRAEFAPR